MTKKANNVINFKEARKRRRNMGKNPETSESGTQELLGLRTIFMLSPSSIDTIPEFPGLEKLSPELRDYLISGAESHRRDRKAKEDPWSYLSANSPDYDTPITLEEIVEEWNKQKERMITIKESSKIMEKAAKEGRTLQEQIKMSLEWIIGKTLEKK
jgi:hypothetical protein